MKKKHTNVKEKWERDYTEKRLKMMKKQYRKLKEK